jgi:hypothetical protein
MTALLLACVLAALCLAFSRMWPAAPLPLLVGMLWIVLGRKRGAGADLGLLLLAVCVLVALLQGSSLGLSLPAIACALAAWDLDRFSALLRRKDWRIDDPDRLTGSHVALLALVLVLGMGAGWLATMLPVDIGFRTMVAAMLLSIALFGLLLRRAAQ